MNSKKILCGSFAAVLAVTSFAGCSKGSGSRKIEGASDEANKVVNVMEEVYDMKGIVSDMTMDVKGDTEEGSATGKLKMTSLIDSSNNMKFTVNADMKVQDKEIKGDLAALYVVDSTVYVDLSGAYSTIVTAVGEEQVDNMLKMTNLTADDLKTALCFSIPMGDFKASDFSLESMKSVITPIMDDYAIAMSEAKLVSGSDDSYTVDLSGDAAAKFVTEFSKAFDKNADKFYDSLVSYIEKLKLDTKTASFVDAFVGEIAKGLSAATGQEVSLESMGIDKEQIKTQVADAVKKLKDEKDANLKEIKDALVKAGTSDAADVKDAKFTIKDEKDGYSIKMPASFNGDLGSLSGSVSGTADATVKSSSDKVSAPSGAVPLSTTIEKLGGVIMMFASGMGSFLG